MRRVTFEVGVEEEEEEEERGNSDLDLPRERLLTEECGTIPQLQCNFESWVLSEGWPSWSFVLKSLGSDDLHTAVQGLSLTELMELKASGLDRKSIYSWTALLKMLEKKSTKDRRMWIQGSRQFVVDSIKLAKQFHFTSFTCVIVEQKRVTGKLPPLDDLEWLQLNHERLGGLSKGVYRVLTSASVDKNFLYAKSKVRPRLKHILQGKEEGERVDVTEIESLIKEKGFLTGQSLVKTGTDFVPVLSPSIFLRDELVKRNLSSRELMDVYDVDVNVQNNLCNYAMECRSSPSNTFVRQAPGKVLYRLALAVLQPLEPKDTPTEETTDTTIRSPGINEQEPRKTSLDRLSERLTEELLKLDPTATPPVKEVDSRPKATLIPDANVKAAKNDDAKANESEWNERAGRNLKGGYDPETHDIPLDLLRDASLRWYQNKVRKSFTGYLVATYGKNWYELAHGNSAAVTGKKRKREDEKVETPSFSLFDLDNDDTAHFASGDRHIGANRDEAGSSDSSERAVFEAMMSDPNTEGLKMSAQDSLRKELLKDLKVGRDAVRRAGLASWWEWDAGSSLFFWRWPAEYKKDVRDGLEVCVEGQLPEYWARQNWPKDLAEREQLKKKLYKPVFKNYIARGFVKSLTSFFAVLKGEDDIRIVYDATKSLLNESIWAPNFFLPTVDSVLRNADTNTWYGDIDLGEMFLNYFLDEKLRPYAGVDVSGIRELLVDHFHELPGEDKRRLVMRWERNLMGLSSSPYNSTRTFAWSEDFIRGDRHDPANPLRWDRVVLNLIGSENYDPAEPDVYKYDDINKKPAAFFETYVDDIRSGDSGGEEACHRTTHVIASRINYLGQQDSPRKRRKVSMVPGAWAGAMVITKPNDGLYVTCSQEKWDKARDIISGLYQKVLEDPKGRLDRKSLESQRGFLIHICRTFTQMVPYMKGIHHTLESWRFGRDRNGWKFATGEMMRWLNDEVDFECDSGDKESITRSNWKDVFKNYKERHQGEAPVSVEPVERLRLDLKSLKMIFEPMAPIHRLIRGSSIKKVKIMFGDASGAGFGSTWETNNGTIRFRYGLWGENMNDSSSNLRELLNLVDTLEKMKAEGELKGTEIYVFTDNSTAECAFFKGTSKSEKLHDLVLRLRLLEGEASCRVHFVHVAGKRMIAQGADGLSRGNLTEGVMGGWSMGDFVPLHLGALERSKPLEKWIRSWCDTSKHKAEILKPEGWFERGHDLSGGSVNSDGMWVPAYKNGVYIWAPPPAAAEAALEQLRKARHKRQESCHIFVCPRLMTPYWSKHVNRSADLLTVIPPGTSFWPKEMYEPLILGIYLPFLKNRPWQLKGQPALLGLDKHLRKMWKKNPGASSTVLRKLWRSAREMASMPEKLVRSLLRRRSSLYVSSCQTGKRRRAEVGTAGRSASFSKK